MNGRDRAGAAGERVRARLAASGARRRDAVSRAVSEPDLGEDEITGRFLALAEKQAEAVAAAGKAVARASRPDESLPPLVRKTKRYGRVAAALAVAGAGFVALAKWAWRLF